MSSIRQVRNVGEPVVVAGRRELGAVGLGLALVLLLAGRRHGHQGHQGGDRQLRQRLRTNVQRAVSSNLFFGRGRRAALRRAGGRIDSSAAPEPRSPALGGARWSSAGAQPVAASRQRIAALWRPRRFQE